MVIKGNAAVLQSEKKKTKHFGFISRVWKQEFGGEAFT